MKLALPFGNGISHTLALHRTTCVTTRVAETSSHLWFGSSRARSLLTSRASLVAGTTSFGRCVKCTVTYNYLCKQADHWLQRNDTKPIGSLSRLRIYNSLNFFLSLSLRGCNSANLQKVLQYHISPRVRMFHRQKKQSPL